MRRARTTTLLARAIILNKDFIKLEGAVFFFL